MRISIGISWFVQVKGAYDCAQQSALARTPLIGIVYTCDQILYHHDSVEVKYNGIIVLLIRHSQVKR